MGLVFFNCCKQFGDAVLDLVGHFKDEFFKLNPIIFKFLPSKDCFLGLLGELVFPTCLHELLFHLVDEVLIVPLIQPEQVFHQPDW